MLVDVARWLVAALLLTSATVSMSGVSASTVAPDFTLRTLEGPTLRLQEHRGRVVMVNFWASWCAPCRQEMPHLNRLYERYRPSGFTLLGVNIDDDPRLASDLAARFGLKFPVLLDTDKKVSRLYDMGAMPATVVIDRTGRVRFFHLGYQSGLETTYEKQIRDLLKE